MFDVAVKRNVMIHAKIFKSEAVLQKNQLTRILLAEITFNQFFFCHRHGQQTTLPDATVARPRFCEAQDRVLI